MIFEKGSKVQAVDELWRWDEAPSPESLGMTEFRSPSLAGAGNLTEWFAQTRSERSV